MLDELLLFHRAYWPKNQMFQIFVERRMLMKRQSIILPMENILSLSSKSKCPQQASSAGRAWKFPLYLLSPLFEPKYSLTC